MEASLDDDLERVSSVLSQEADTKIRVTLDITDGRTMEITVRHDEIIHEAVLRWLECDEAEDLRYVQLGDDAVGDDESFEDAGIEDGARLSVSLDELSPRHALLRLRAMGARDAYNDPCTARQVVLQGTFERVPREIFKLTELEMVHLRNCYHLTCLPRQISQLSKLKLLHLGNCTGITTLPQEITQLTNLEQLNLSGCSGLTGMLPSTVGQFINLKELYLNGCTGLKGLPAEMAQLTALEILNISDCSGLETLPDLSVALPRIKIVSVGASDMVGMWEQGGYKAYSPHEKEKCVTA